KESVTEKLCCVNDRLLEKYIEQGLRAITEEELLEAYAESFSKGDISPFVAGAALVGDGVEEFLDLIEFLARRRKISEKEDGLSAVIFNMKHDPQMGRVAYARLFSGCIKNRDLVYNASNDSYEKAVQIKKVTGAKEIDTGKVSAGEIAAIYGLSRSRNGDVLGRPCAQGNEINIASPTVRIRVMPQAETDYPALLDAVRQMSAEDPLLEFIWEQSSRELILSVTGRLQIEVIETLLKERYLIDAVIGSPQIIYKERPSRHGYGYVEYTMPKPCWAVLNFEIEPLETGSGVIFESRARNEKIFPKYQAQVEQTIPDALRQGPKGWQVTDLKITLVDGEHHVAHTHPMDFILATPIGIMDALMNTGTDLMEPINRFRITYPEEMTGKMIGEIIGMRGTFDSPSIRKGTAVMAGRYPVAEGIDFPARFLSVTGGRGMISTYFDSYEPCPPGAGEEIPFRGISPADREKYILHKRGAVI
ncbi:MAG: GTP-binding protein, partial [Synergistaceae bacterium]|nr:GTP-binding protein [Synergistaceae bacterium]